MLAYFPLLTCRARSGHTDSMPFNVLDYKGYNCENRLWGQWGVKNNMRTNIVGRANLRRGATCAVACPVLSLTAGEAAKVVRLFMLLCVTDSLIIIIIIITVSPAGY